MRILSCFWIASFLFPAKPSVTQYQPSIMISTSHLQTKSSLQARLLAQNELFKEQFESDMKASPETATAYGEYRYNARLDDRSLAFIAQQNVVDASYRAKLQKISTEGFPEKDRISHELLLRVLDQRMTDYSLNNYEMPVSQMDGVHNRLADLPLAMPLDSLQHYKDYVARLHQIPRAFDETIEVLRQGEKDGLCSPR